MRKNIAIAVLGLLIVSLLSAGTAQAGRLIGSGSIRDNTVRSVDVKDGTIRTRDLAESVIAKFDSLDHPGVKGDTGPRGEQGPKGEQGQPGDPASDVKGDGGTVFDSSSLITNIGGAFTSRRTNFGTFTLSPGTYLLNFTGYFDRVDNAQASSPQMMIALRSANGGEMGTVLTGNFPATGDREMTGSGSTVVTITEQTPVSVYVFGYNNDGSSAGSGNYAANVQVSAVRVN